MKHVFVSAALDEVKDQSYGLRDNTSSLCVHLFDTRSNKPVNIFRKMSGQIKRKLYMEMRFYAKIAGNRHAV